MDNDVEEAEALLLDRLPARVAWVIDYGLPTISQFRESAPWTPKKGKYITIIIGDGLIVDYGKSHLEATRKAVADYEAGH